MSGMTIRGKAFVAGVYEHPLREISDRSLAQIHAEVALGALADAGLTLDDVDGYLCAGDAPGFGPMSMADYLGLGKLSYLDSTETGGSSYNVHVGHAAAAIAAGKCTVALITLAGQPRAAGTRVLGGGRDPARPGAVPNPVAVLGSAPESGFEGIYGPNVLGMYALAATRHMYEFGTTSEQLAWVKVAASTHAQHNPSAVLPYAVTVADVLASPLVADPLHRLDCCVITDGGGAVVVVSPEVAKTLGSRCIKLLGHGEAPKHTMGGNVDLTFTGARWSGPRAFEEARVTPKDIDYASIYDSFTITVVETIEDLGFCEKGEGGAFVADGGLISPGGRLPFNTDGGGLCNNHPANRGGMTKTIETVRQLRGEANPAVQVPNCQIAIAHGNGGSLGTRSAAATLILGVEDA
jgi:acetyl-CoA C-acetyltransferase